MAITAMSRGRHACDTYVRQPSLALAETSRRATLRSTRSTPLPMFSPSDLGDSIERSVSLAL